MRTYPRVRYRKLAELAYQIQVQRGPRQRWQAAGRVERHGTLRSMRGWQAFPYADCTHWTRKRSTRQQAAADLIVLLDRIAESRRQENPMTESRFITEPDPEFENQVRVIERSTDPETDGRIVGWTTGEDAAEDAAYIATILNETGRQPTEEGCARNHYTIKNGCDF